MVEFKEVNLAIIFGGEEIIKLGKDFVPVGRAVGDAAKKLMSFELSKIVNHMGELSAEAQHLNESVTSTKQMREDQWLYLMREPNHGTDKICGLLKAGFKDLYLYDERGDLKLMKRTPALLDFYIHESCQRRGYGKALYDFMLVSENWRPEKIAIDRPSNLLISFMKSKFGLSQTLPQANHFAIYSGFFGHEKGPSGWNHSQKMRNDLKTLNGPGGAGNTRSCGERN